jgi:nucleotide-binding universal stress UspA family protein
VIAARRIGARKFDHRAPPLGFGQVALGATSAAPPNAIPEPSCLVQIVDGFTHHRNGSIAVAAPGPFTAGPQLGGRDHLKGNLLVQPHVAGLHHQLQPATMVGRGIPTQQRDTQRVLRQAQFGIFAGPLRGLRRLLARAQRGVIGPKLTEWVPTRAMNGRINRRRCKRCWEGTPVGVNQRLSDLGAMSGYHTLVVGTDGSQTSSRAVDRAAEIAARSNAKLIIATGYSSGSSASRKSSAILREASDRAQVAGAKNIEERPIPGAPVEALVGFAEEARADLLIVGRVGLDPIIGRLFSVPGNVSRRAKTDVLIVHTTG